MYEAYSSFTSDDDSSDDRSSIEIVHSQDSIGFNLSLSSLSVPLDEDDDEEDEDSLRMFDIHSSSLSN